MSCSQPSCLIPEFTEECTDNCLVVACDDPDHGSPACLVTNGEIPCDGTCITAAACDDCTGLDEIVSPPPTLPTVPHPPPQLQCCTDYHTYLMDQKSYWESSFPDLPCDCAQDLQSTYPQPPLPQSIQDLISDPSISSSASSSPSLASFSPPLHAPSPFALQSTSTQSFPCMWASCGAVFNNLSDLVGHVNLHHLCSINPQSLSTLPVQSQDDFSQTPLFCHWGDCEMFPSPSSVPSSSSASSDDDVLNILAAHLLQDHLGLSIPPSATTLQPPLADPHITSEPVQSSSPTPPSHDCSGTHVCKWKTCTQTFPSCDDLTSHIASVHIGGGKAHYECFWEGCARHGTNGFSSKQKISRHIQVCVSPHSMPSRSSHALVTHWPPPFPMPGMQPMFLRSCNSPTAHAPSHTRE